MNSAQPVWITVAEAAVLLKLKPATVIRRIQRGSSVGAKLYFAIIDTAWRLNSSGYGE